MPSPYLLIFTCSCSFFSSAHVVGFMLYKIIRHLVTRTLSINQYGDLLSHVNYRDQYFDFMERYSYTCNIITMIVYINSQDI